jgi:hypothetical protein
MANAQIEFTVSWVGGGKARLHYIIDNDNVVATEDDDLDGYSPITFVYSTAGSAIHSIEWSLWFPGRTVRKLVAKAGIDGSVAVTLDSKKDESKNKWASRGAAP